MSKLIAVYHDDKEVWEVVILSTDGKRKTGSFADGPYYYRSYSKARKAIERLEIRYKIRTPEMELIKGQDNK